MNEDTNKEWKKEFDERFRMEDAAREGKIVGHSLGAEIKSFIARAIDQARAAERAALREKAPKEGTQVYDYIVASEGAYNPTAADIAFEEGWNACRGCFLTLLDNHE